MVSTPVDSFGDIVDGDLVDLTEVARSVVETHAAAPGAVVAAAHRQPSGRWRIGTGHWGRLTYGADSRPVTPRTLYDLASLTKPVVALTAARLEQIGKFARQTRVSEALPSLADTASGATQLDLLMSHRAGLQAHVELYADERATRRAAPSTEWRPPGDFDKRSALRRVAEAIRPECQGAPPADGFPPVYSDLGYQITGAAIESAVALPLDAVVAREVTEPLGLRIGSAAQLEIMPGSKRAPAVAPTEDLDFRGGLICGVVHDDNAWILSGLGMSGHAGLFGDAPSVLRLGISILDAQHGRSSWLSDQSLEPLLRPRSGGTHRAGFDGRSDDAPSSGTRFGPNTFGHLGFTGTSIWMDPDIELCGVLLTNRVHPSRDHIAIRPARPDAYDALHLAMTGF